jgi:transposase
MAKREFQLSEEQQLDLRRAYESTQNAEERRRLQAVRLYGEGRSVSDIQSITGCGYRSLLRWCRDYLACGVAGLKDGRVGGNRAKLTKEQRAEIRQKVNEYRPDQILPPDIRVSQGAFWTVSDLRIAVERWYGVEYHSPTSYITLLHECRFSQQKPAGQYRSRASEQAIADFEGELEKK